MTYLCKNSNKWRGRRELFQPHPDRDPEAAAHKTMTHHHQTKEWEEEQGDGFQI
jgi:hypothetical protein